MANFQQTSHFGGVSKPRREEELRGRPKKETNKSERGQRGNEHCSIQSVGNGVVGAPQGKRRREQAHVGRGITDKQKLELYEIRNSAMREIEETERAGREPDPYLVKYVASIDGILQKNS